MGWDSKPTLVDAWCDNGAGDDEHQDGWPHEVSGETAGNGDRFDLSTRRATVRRRIPLPSRDAARVVSIDAEPPPRPLQVADGSSPDVFGVGASGGITVEVRLRRDVAPSSAQIDDVVAWLRKRRIPRQVDARGTPPPMPALRPVPPAPPPPLLQPLIRVEPTRGPLWPLLALSVGLAIALMAAIIL